jgi:hypothetical protein
MMSLPAKRICRGPVKSNHATVSTITCDDEPQQSVFAYEWLLLNTAASASSFAMMTSKRTELAQQVTWAL